MTITLSKQGQPRTTFKGTWTLVRATGRYAEYTSGQGTYSGYMTAPEAYVVDREGQFKVQRQVTWDIFQLVPAAMKAMVQRRVFILGVSGAV